jgi:hypothetical protein
VVRLAAGGKTIASTRTRLAQAREFKGRLRVTPKGERLLKKTKGKLAASLTVKFVPDDGADPETYTSKLTLRR